MFRRVLSFTLVAAAFAIAAPALAYEPSGPSSDDPSAAAGRPAAAAATHAYDSAAPVPSPDDPSAVVGARRAGAAHEAGQEPAVTRMAAVSESAG
jgi:hypothetical protein